MADDLNEFGSGEAAVDTDPDPGTETIDDEEKDFVTTKDVKSLTVSPSFSTDKVPGQHGFIADIIEGMLMKVDEMEYGFTQHPVFLRSPADEKIERGIAVYVESQLDPAKYGVVVLLAAYASSQGLKWAIYGKAVADAKKKNEPRKKK